MNTPGSDTPQPAGGDGFAGTERPARKRRRATLVLVAAAAAFVLVLGIIAVVIARGEDTTDPLDASGPGLANVTMRTRGDCRFEPDRGGMVAHFDVRTSDVGQFTVTLSAVTDEGADDLDEATTEHAVRVTVPFYGGRARKQFDVVVPLTEAEHEQGYRKCRYDVYGAG
jgi:hypothetical protein